MTSKLYQTDHYIWSTKEIIGNGATSSVYRGRKKLSGEAVAVKMFNKAGMSRPQDVQDRELEILQKLKHENIVEMLGIERESTSRNPVVVMEICSGGSLFNVIEKPENYYGLAEEEFLRFLSDTMAGIKYLREHDVVHRDLKPGNILRAENEDGTYAYKLSDFGAARELGPEEQFMSIYGTEEYLNPKMYEQAVLRTKRRQKFDSSVDLWSIGVTVFHAATGKLPFQAHGGRNNREMMHRIITEKSPNAISGIQRNEREDSVEYSDRLPSSTQLCRALSDDLTILLRKLLDPKQSEINGFKWFLDSCEELILTKCVHVFSMHDTRIFHVHVDPSSKFTTFAAKLALLTGITTNNREYYFEGNLVWRNGSRTPAAVSALPQTTPEKPIVLFCGDHVHEERLFYGHIPKAPPEGRSTAAADLHNDDQTAKVCLAMCNQHLRVALRIWDYCRGIVSSFRAVSNALRTEWAEMALKIAEAKAVREPIRVKCTYLLEKDELERQLLKNCLSPDQLADAGVKQSLEFLSSCYERQERELRTVQQKFKHTLLGVEERPNILLTSWEKHCERNTAEFAKWKSILQTCVKGVQGIREMFYKERKQGRISYLDEHNHVFEKKRLYEITKKAHAIVNHFVKVREGLHEELTKWMRSVGHQRETMQQVLYDVKKEENEYRRLDEELNKWDSSRTEKVRLLKEAASLKRLPVGSAKADSKYWAEIQML